MQALRDAMSQISSRNAVVFGVSADSVESHKKFHDQYNLNFPLLADPEKKAIAAYGALSQNGQFANRYTFIIGPDGRIEHIDRNVNAQFDRGEKLTSRHGDNLALLLGDWRAEVGKPVPAFSLPGTDGSTVAAFPPGKKATVVMFLSTRCPASSAYNERLMKLASDPAYRDVAFVAVMPNAGESMDDLRRYATAEKLSFPIGRDEGAKLAGHFAAQTTPTVWVIDSKGKAVYSGAVDDNPDPAAVKFAYLKDALDAALAGKVPPVARTRASGCAIHGK